MLANIAFVIWAGLHPPVDTTRGPCGWSATDIDADGLPHVVNVLMSRMQTGATLPPAILSEVSSWVHSCDELAGHVAVSDMRKFASKHASDPAAQALVGVLLARGPEVELVGSVGTVFRAAYKYSNSEKEATRIFSKTLSAHPWPEVAIAFAQLATEVRTPNTLKAAREALIGVTRSADADGLVWGALGDVALALQDDTLLMKASARAVELGDPAGVRRYAIAQMLTQPDPSPGAMRYFDGLSASDDKTLELYHEDMLPLFTDEESAMWDSIAPANRREWLRKSWEWRASIATVPVAARLQEHFKRVRYAYTEYWRGQYRGAPPISMLWLDPALARAALNDQGLVYVRHGEPDTVIKMHGVGVMRMAWYYRALGGGRALLEFKKASAPFAWSDYFLTEPFRCNDGTFADQLHTSRVKIMVSQGALADYVEEILALDPSIQPDGCSNTIAGDTGSVHLTHVSSGQSRRLIGHAIMQTESAAPRMREPIDALLNTYAFRQGTATQIIAFVSADAGGIRRDTTVTQPQYNLKVFAAVENASTHSVVRTDTMFGINPPMQFRKGDAMDMTLLLDGTPAPASTVRVAIRNAADSTQGQIVSTVREIPDYHAATLMSSDIVLGRSGSARWDAKDSAPIPLPGHRMSVNEPFKVYYELYGVGEAGPAQTTISITPERRKGITGAVADLIKQRRALTVQYTERLEPDRNGTAKITHDVQAALEPGAYFVDVTTVSGGRTVTQHTSLTVY